MPNPPPTQPLQYRCPSCLTPKATSNPVLCSTPPTPAGSPHSISHPPAPSLHTPLTRSWLSVSRELVASSRMSTQGSRIKARAMATPCRCPPETWPPISPTSGAQKTARSGHLRMRGNWGPKAGQGAVAEELSQSHTCVIAMA